MLTNEQDVAAETNRTKVETKVVGLIAQETGIEMRVYSREELRAVMGTIADSRNSLRVVEHPQVGPVLIKQYADNQEVNARKRAAVEYNTLKIVRTRGFNQCPRVLKGLETKNLNGVATNVIEYIGDLYPGSSMVDEVLDEALGDNDYGMLDSTLSLLADFHKTGHIHSDLHLGNVNFKSTSGTITEASTYFLDFESATRNDDPIEYTGYLRKDDIVFFVADILAEGMKKHGESFVDADFPAIEERIQRSYLDKLGDRTIDVSKVMDEAKVKAKRAYWEDN